MKMIGLGIGVLLVLTSCRDGAKGPVSLTDAQVETKATNSAVIPVYDFNELEAKYFKQNDSSTYVINFWATWCKPCVKELPAFEALNAQYKDKGVKVILVSLDFPEKLETSVIPFIEKNQLQSHVVLLDDSNANTWIPKVSEAWSGAIPATIIIKDGKRYFFEQSFTLETLKKEIETIL